MCFSQLATMQAVDLNPAIMPSIEASSRSQLTPQTVDALRQAKPAFWAGRTEHCQSTQALSTDQVQQAVDRLARFAPFA